MEILENYIKNVAYKQEQEDIIGLYNIFKDRLTPENNKRLFYYVLWKGGNINKILLDLYIKKLNLKLSDFISLLIFNYNSKSILSRLDYILKNYKKYITEIEVREIVLNIKLFNIYNKNDIFNLFLDNGFRFDNCETKYLTSIFSIRKDFVKREYNLQLYKDRVLCRHLYKELKNTYDISINNVIHITGSNGKGSTCAFIEHIV